METRYEYSFEKLLAVVHEIRELHRETEFRNVDARALRKKINIIATSLGLQPAPFRV
jgi:hypothetical protein